MLGNTQVLPCAFALNGNKIGPFKTAPHLKARQIRGICGAEDDGGPAPGEDNKPESSGFDRLSGVLSLSPVSLRLSFIFYMIQHFCAFVQ
jgi:hypothetical protein